MVITDGIRRRDVAVIRDDAGGHHRQRVAVDQPAAEVDEVAPFAENAPAAFIRILDPVLRRDDPALTRKFTTMGVRRSANAARSARAWGEKRRLNPTIRQGRRPAVRALARACSMSSILGVVDAERLLDEDVLAGAQRRADQRRVTGVPCGDEHRVGGGILQHLAVIARGCRELENAPRRAGRYGRSASRYRSAGRRRRRATEPPAATGHRRRTRRRR